MILGGGRIVWRLGDRPVVCQGKRRATRSDGYGRGKRANGRERKGRRAKRNGVVGLLRRGDLVGLELLLRLSGVEVESFGGRAMVVLVSRDDVPDGGDDDDTHEDNYGIVHAITGYGDRGGHAEQWDGEKTPRCKGSAVLDMSP